jgi:DMSO/TMAO reductase YedYZ molybdopterin-dependent catalytic subunit
MMGYNLTSKLINPVIAMPYPADPEKIRTPKAMARREFVLGAVAVSGLASKYVRALPNSLAIGSTVHPAVDTTNSNEILPRLVTPNIDFFIRNHFTTPAISEENWNLELSGAVSKPLKLSYSDLLLSSSIRRPLTLECAGNPSGGRGVSTAVWSGVLLAELLTQAGAQAGATTVIFHGADSGEVEGLPAGTHYQRAIPIEKAMDPTTLLAYEMNSAPLPPEHGFPLRALVAGWYGMDSVKWLTRIEVSQEPFQGYFQKQSYIAIKSNGDRRPITGMRVNSSFIRPLEDEGIRGKSYRIEGVAWAGDRKISKVELRFASDRGWQPAVLPASQVPMVWTPWSYEWNVPRAGQYTIEVRATDEQGNAQPLVRDPDRLDEYELNTAQQVRVKVQT